jgi:Putative zinc-finger
VSTLACTAAAPELIAYWLGELADDREAELDEHLFGCEACGARLRELVRLGEGIQRVTRAGDVHAVLTAAFIRRLQQSGLRVREYRLRPGGSVNCTVTPDDDLVIAHLHAPLEGVRRLDLLFDDVTQGARWRVEDVAFDPATDEVVIAPNVTELRGFGFATQRVQLIAVEPAAERVIGDYTFNHSPYGGS